MFLSDISIKRPIMISMLLIVFLVFGGLAYFGLSLDMFPEVEIGFVTVRTIYPGAGPKEIESQVTKKIEDSVATIGKIEFIQSYSMDSVSIVMLKFDLGKDADLATQEVKDKVDAILNDLPDDAETPLVEKFDLRAEPVLDVVLSGKMDGKALYEVADKQLKDRFSQIEGVARVNLVGGQEREIRIELDNRVVFENAVSLAQLSQILKVQNMDMPGGQFLQQSQEYAVRLSGLLKSIEAIKELDVPTAFGKKKLGRLADIRDTGSDVRERTTYFDNIRKFKEDNVVLLSIIKSVDGNTVDMVRAIRERLPQIEGDLPAGCNLSIVNDKSVFIESSVSDTLSNIFLGVLLTALVLLFFLHDIRSTIIVAMAMPFSIISTFLLMQISGFSLNMMTLMGLSIAVGILVTNSVVVLENIFRHKEMGHGRREAAGKGAAEIAVAVIASTMTNIVVFLPIASMTSLVGQFFKEFALTVTFATLFSLLVSFTLTPMMASLVLPETDTKKHPLGQKLEKLFHLWERWYKKILSVLLANRLRSFIVLCVAVLLFILSFFSAARVGFEFMPELDEGDIRVQVELPQGYNLNETAALLKTIEERIEKHPEVKHILSRMGSVSETDIGTNLANIAVKLVDVEKREISSSRAANIFIRELSDIPNARIRVSATASGAGEEAPVQFFLLGQDVDLLEVYKTDIVNRIKTVPGLVNAGTSSRSGKPEITLVPDRRKLTDAGLTVYDLAMTLRSAVEGIEATRYKEGGEEYDIRVVLKKESVDTPEEVGNIAVVSPAGVYRLSQLADVKFAEGYSKILHRDKYKAIEFTGYIAPGYVLGDVVTKIREHLDRIDLPGGYKIDWGGSVKLMEESMIDMGRTFLIALLLTYMLLAAVLESLTQPLMILGTVPLALIGVFTAMDMTGKTMNIMSMMAIVMLLGIVVNNAILLLDYTNILRKEGKGVSEALLQACPTRLKPILMATIAIILGMMPMALGIGAAGKEFRQPLGIVSIGGLVVSSILTLVVIPAVYNLTTRRKTGIKKKKSAAAVLPVLLLLFLPALQVRADGTVYDLDAFLARVESHSKDLQLAKKELDMAKVNKKEALSTALPKVQIEGNYKRNLKDNFLYIDFPDFDTGEMTNQKFKINYKNEFGLSAVLNQTLFSFKVGTALRAAKEYKKLTGFAYDAAHRTILTLARKGFYRALLLKKVWEVGRASEENARENYLNMKKKFDNGQISEFHLLQSEVRWRNLMPDTTRAKRNYELALNSLKNLAGIPVEEEINLEGGFDRVPPMPGPVPTASVLERRPDFNALLWEEKLRGTGVKAETGNRYPSLSLNLIYNFSSLSDQFKLERRNESYIVGLNLAVPLYTGGYREAQVQKAKIELEKTRIKIDKEKEAIYKDLRDIRLRLDEARKRMVSAEKSLETAKKAFDIAEITAANGLATQLELKDARVLYDRATLNLYASTYDYLDAYFDWQQAVGN